VGIGVKKWYRIIMHALSAQAAFGHRGP